MDPVCKLCLKDAKIHVKILGTSEVTKAIEEIFHIKITDKKAQTLEILCIECHNTVAEFYVFYNNIRSIQNVMQETWLHEEELRDVKTERDKGKYELFGSDSEHEPVRYDDDHHSNDHEKVTEYYMETDLVADQPVIKPVRARKSKQIVKSEQNDEDDDEEILEIEVNPSHKKDSQDEFTFTIRQKKPRKVQTFHCDVCGATFKKYSFMKAHILQKHLGIFEDVCPHCGKTSFDKSSLKRHIDAVHLKTYKRRRDICPDCGVAVVALKLHRQLKHGIGEKVEKVLYACDKCELQYTKPMYLKRHYQRKHLKQFNDKCPFCQKTFYNRMSVERHMQSQHPDLAPEEVKKKKLLENITSPCDVCDKVFHRRANYMRHRRTVHKDIPFNMVPTTIKTE